ncbi:MAG: ATP-binding cassette domain-containing protein, partial [Pseudomonadota bacterium]|nr:ATP-binding cassette domain-containing protein [Pseudomonadota bacterium]
ARYRHYCTGSLISQFRAQQFNVIMQTLSQALVMVTGVVTICAGTVLAIEGELSAGALIAIVALIWRLLSPIQTVFLGLNRLTQTVDTLKQVDNLMRMQTERRPGHIPTFERNFAGQITLAGLGFRYGPRYEPAIKGISLVVEPGQIVAITGHSGAGKSTLLKLAAGLYQPQAGAVVVDRMDLRQIDPAQFRHAIGFVPETLDFFYGTIAQNIRLADPMSSDEQIKEALQLAGAWDAVSALPEGLETRLKTSNRRKLPAGLLQQLCLARAYVKNPGIYLLDDPGAHMDRAADIAFIKQLKALAGRATVLLVTHRPSHMYCADRVVVMKQGTIAAEGTPAQIVPNILKHFQRANVS